MRTGLHIYRKIRFIISYFNLFRFWLRKTFLGFEFANIFLKRVDKISLQLILKKNGAAIGDDCDIESGLIFHNCKDYSNLVIGNNCHIGKNCFFDLRDKVIIGNNVVISMQCTFITHIDMSKSHLSKKYPAEKDKIIISDNCYIGAGAMILKGVILNDYSFIAAKSLVINDISSYKMVGGIPAKEL